MLVSAASIWEIAIKRTLGRVDAPADLDEVLAAEGFEELPIRWTHARRAGALPRHHDDLFDRVLIVQAQDEQLVLVTSDARMSEYDVPRLEAG